MRTTAHPSSISAVMFSSVNPQEILFHSFLFVCFLNAKKLVLVYNALAPGNLVITQWKTPVIYPCIGII